MYISQLVKTRRPHSGLLQLPSCFLIISSIGLNHLISHLFLSIHLLLVDLGGSATMPSHIQRGPSVAIPSV
jgi:hypothetical protein